MSNRPQPSTRLYPVTTSSKRTVNYRNWSCSCRWSASSLYLSNNSSRTARSVFPLYPDANLIRSRESKPRQRKSKQRFYKGLRSPCVCAVLHILFILGLRPLIRFRCVADIFSSRHCSEMLLSHLSVDSSVTRWPMAIGRICASQWVGARGSSLKQCPTFFRTLKYGLNYILLRFNPGFYRLDFIAVRLRILCNDGLNILIYDSL